MAQQDGLRDRDPDLDASKNIAADLGRASFRSGNLYLISTFRLGDVGYNSSDSFYLPTSDHSEGVSFTVEAPHRLYVVAHKKVIFSGEVSPGYTLLTDSDRKGQLSIRTRGDAHFLFNHIYLNVYGIGSQYVASETTEINRIGTVDDRQYGLDGEFKYSSKSSLVFRANNTTLSHPENKLQPVDEVPVELLDRQERNYRAAFRHRTFPLTSFSVAAERSDYTFDFASYKDSSREYFGGGLVYDNGKIRLRAEAGPARLTFKDPTLRSFKGALGSADIQRQTRRWLLTAGVERDLQFSVLASNNYYTVDQGSVAAEFAATPRLRLRIGSSLAKTNYDLPEANGVYRQDDIAFSWIGFRYTRRKFTGGLDLGWYERTSTIGGDEESGIRTILHLSFSP